LPHPVEEPHGRAQIANNSFGLLHAAVTENRSPSVNEVTFADFLQEVTRFGKVIICVGIARWSHPSRPSVAMLRVGFHRVRVPCGEPRRRRL